MNCWICGSKGDSGEHLSKATDIKSVFGEISQRKPLVLRKDDNTKKKLGSRKADALKSSAPICTQCNNVRTSSHDRAWEKLSEFLRQYPLDRRGPLSIRLSKVFKHDRYKNVLAVHLYFVKLFGCRIVENSIPIDTDSFSESILKEKPNPLIFIHFKKGLVPKLKTVGLSNIQASNDETGTIVGAVWTYIVDNLFVDISYSRTPARTEYLKNSFHPQWKNKVINFQDYETTTNEI